MTDFEHVAALAESLYDAERLARPRPPVRTQLPVGDIDAAYHVQRLYVRRRVAEGARVVGRKIGLTSAAVQAQLGVDQPDFGALLDDMQVRDGGPIPLAALIRPRVEAEVAFVLARDIEDPDPTVEMVAASVAYASPALEIVDSRIADWDISILDTVADNGSSARFVLGTDRVTLDRFRPVDVEMVLAVDGTMVSRGNGMACLGDPLAALAWLAAAAVRYEAPLRAGEIVLSGALGPMHSVTSGCSVSAVLLGLGSVSVEFTQEDV